MLKSQVEAFSRVFIVVDALDECLNDAETNTMDNVLKALHQLPENVHMLFTSRHDISIDQKVKPDRKLKVLAADDDLRKYFDSQIASNNHLKRMIDKGVQRDKLFRDNVLSAVVAKSQGMQVQQFPWRNFVENSVQVSTRATAHEVSRLRG